MNTARRRKSLRVLLAVLVVTLLLGAMPSNSSAQSVTIYTDQQLLQRAIAATNARDFFSAAMYFQAYVQRNPAPMRNNANHAKEVQDALNYSIRAVNLALQCRLNPDSLCGVNEQGLIVSRGAGIVSPVVIVHMPPTVTLPSGSSPPSGSPDSETGGGTTPAPSAAVTLFDGSPDANRRRINASFCSGFDSECNFGNCPVNYKLVFGPYCREGDYSYIKPGLYRVSIFGSGPVIAGATDYGTSFQLYGFGRYELNLPGSYTFCWPGREPGGYGFETIVQAGSTSSFVNRIRIEYIGSC